MTEQQVNLDALIAEARRLIAHTRTYNFGMWSADKLAHKVAGELADALESTLAELRQERERAGEATNHAVLALAGRRNAVAALSRAEETIEKVRNLPRHELNALLIAVDAHDIDAILTESRQAEGASMSSTWKDRARDAATNGFTFTSLVHEIVGRSSTLMSGDRVFDGNEASDVADNAEQGILEILRVAINQQGIDNLAGMADWELVELIAQAPCFGFGESDD